MLRINITGGLMLLVSLILLISPIYGTQDSDNGTQKNLVDGKQKTAAYERTLNLVVARYGENWAIADDGTINALNGQKNRLRLEGADVVDRIYRFFELNRDIFQMENPREELIVEHVSPGPRGDKTVSFEQRFRGIRVLFSGYSAITLPDSTFLESVSGYYRPLARTVDVTPNITPEKAKEIAQADPENGKNLTYTNTPELVISCLKDGCYLVWYVGVYGGRFSGDALYQIDAHTGAILKVDGGGRID
jgi:hypothetical protein